MLTKKNKTKQKIVSRVQDIPEEGRQPRRRRQPIIWPIFPKNCMKTPPRSATGQGPKKVNLGSSKLGFGRETRGSVPGSTSGKRSSAREVTPYLTDLKPACVRQKKKSRNIQNRTKKHEWCSDLEPKLKCESESLDLFGLD